MALELDTAFEPAHGTPVEVAPDVRRVTAPNPGPFTFHGTNSYVVGRDSLAVIDPGPDDDVHLAALVAAIAGRPVSHILVSHTHRDHSPLARRLSALTGAVVCAKGPHGRARLPGLSGKNPLDASGDTDFVPDRTLVDGEIVEGDGWALETVLTPGHAANHAAFALRGGGVLFSADHVMAWSTTVVAPPDGSMADYMRSLDRLLERRDGFYLPGHGGPVLQPVPFVRALRTHRRMRERAVIERLRGGDRTIAAMVAAIYRDTDPRLHAAAALTVLAHLEDIVSRGDAKVEGEIGLDAVYAPA